jgi:predicted phage-related endonuclease
VGASPWRSEYELALEKKGLVPLDAETRVQTWGHRVEQVAADIYSETTGRRLRRVNRAVTDRRWPHLFAHPDRIVVGEPVGVELKSSWKAWDGVPRHVEVQVQHQMGLARLDAVDVALLTGFGGFATYTVERDDAMIRDLFDLEEAWWARFVMGDEMPPMDGSRAASRFLDSRVGPPEVQADEGQAALAERLRRIRAAIKADEEAERLLVNRLKESMDGAYAMRGEGWRVSWKPSKARSTTDWRSVAAAYRTELLAFHEALGGDATTEAAEALDAIEGLHSATGEGSRPFRLTFEEGDHGDRDE